MRLGPDLPLDRHACRAAESSFEAAVEPWDPAARTWSRQYVAADDVLVGLVAQMPGTGAFFAYVVFEARNLGVGDLLLEAIDGAGKRLAVPEGNPFLGYPMARAFRPVEHIHRWVVFQPPSERTDLRPAASACLVAHGRVLLGRRLVAPWKGYWSFPGGSVERNESTEAAALRELAEETGIQLSPRPAQARTRIAVGSDDGTRAYAIENFVFRLEAPVPALPSQELRAEWVDLEEASSRRPMAAGTRRILRRLGLSWGALGYGATKLNA